MFSIAGSDKTLVRHAPGLNNSRSAIKVEAMISNRDIGFISE
jgi:hypothetical protein